jgi:hypothetical protein
LEKFDFEQFAHQMILEHGSSARTEAAKLAAKMLESREYESYEFWGQAWAAITAAQKKRV